LKALIGKRIEQETGRVPKFPAPAWASWSREGKQMAARKSIRGAA